MKGSKALGEYLKFLRGTNSQEQWGAELGVHRTYISKVESGEFTPPQEIFFKWFEMGHERFKRMQEDAIRFNAMMQVVEQFNEIGV